MRTFARTALVLLTATTPVLGQGGPGSGPPGSGPPPPGPQAAPIHVSKTGSPNNTGMTWATALDDVQHAVKLASTMGTTEVWVAVGTYKPSTPIDLGPVPVQVYGGFAGFETALDDRDWVANPVVLDAAGSHRVIVIADAHGPGTVVDGLTLRNGKADRGGGIYTYAGSPTLRNLVFEGNRATYSQMGTGASADGGALYCYAGTPALENCAFVGNDAADDGGALYSSSGVPTLVSCSFENNSAGGDGGAVWLHGSPSTLRNCVFRLNTAPAGSGGAIWTHDGALGVVQATLVDNMAQVGGGLTSVMGNATVWNSIFHNNTAPTDPQISGAPAVSWSCVMGGYSGPGNMSADPLLVDPVGGDFTPGAGSPCIDAGDSSAVPATLTTDLNGDPRMVDVPGVPDTGLGPAPVVDMGAVERQALPPLAASPAALSLQAGGVQSFQLNAPVQHALMPYIVLGSTAGTSPGLPFGTHVLPLNVDPYFMWTLSNPNLFPLGNTFGVLDATGRATASFTLVPGSPPQWAGAYIHHAYAVLQMTPSFDVVLVSNSVEMLLQP